MESENRELRKIADRWLKIQNSRTWKFLVRARRISERFLPRGGRLLMLAQCGKVFLDNPRLCLRYLRPQKVRSALNLILRRDSEGFRHSLQVFIPQSSTAIVVSPVVKINSQTDSNIASKWQPLVLRPCEKPTVSIIIPAYNQWSYTYSCIESLVKAEPDLDYEVILADDCSNDDTPNASIWIKNLIISRSERNLGFLRNCNFAAKIARGRFIYLLNNDTQLQTRAISALLGVFRRHADAGMVGSKLVYPNGRLQEAGGIVWKDASAWNFGRLSDPDLPEFNYLKEADYCSGASLMIPSELWRSLGGFSEEYLPAYCEDTDLAYQIRAAGKKVYYQPRSVIVHFEGISHGTDEKTGIKAHQVANARKFHSKWRTVLETESFPNAEQVFWARDRSRSRKTVLFIDHYVPKPDRDAGSRTIFQYLVLAVQLGYNVKFLSENFYYDPDYRQLLEDQGIEILAGVYYRDHWKDWLADHGLRIAAVFFSRPHITEFFLNSVLTSCPNARLIYYGHDLHYLREERQYQITGDLQALDRSRKWKIREDAICGKIHCYLSISGEEQRIVAKQFPDLEAIVFPVFYWAGLEALKPTPEDRNGFLFIGGFGHLPNVDGLLWFLNEVWPRIKAELPNAVLQVAGSNAPPEISTRKDPGMFFHGQVSDDKLNLLYRSVRIAVIPLRYGAGVKGKTVEAMRHGVPIICTSTGIEGLDDLPSSISGHDDPDEFASSAVTLHESAARWMEHCSDQFNYIRQRFSRERAVDTLQRALGL